MFVYKFVTRFTRTFWQYVKPIHMFIVTTLGPGALIIVYNTYKTPHSIDCLIIMFPLQIAQSGRSILNFWTAEEDIPILSPSYPFSARRVLPRHQRRVRFLEQKAKEMVKQHEMCPTKCGNYIMIYYNGDVIAS